MQGTPLTILDDVEASLDAIEALQESQSQSRNGQENQRVYDPIATELLKELLAQAKETNFHLQILTGEHYDY